MNGPRFDRQFTKDQVTAEERALAVYKHEAKYGENNDVKAYASAMIPVLNNNLKRAEQFANTGSSTK